MSGSFGHKFYYSTRIFRDERENFAFAGWKVGFPSFNRGSLTSNVASWDENVALQISIVVSLL
jgi:hypothetical protein